MKRGTARVFEWALHTLVVWAIFASLFPHVFLAGHRITPAYLFHERMPWRAYVDPESYPHDRYYPAIEFLCQWNTWYAVANEAWDAGEWPLWNPRQNLGVPLLANYQSAFFYPLRVPYAWWGVSAASTFYVLLKLWLCAVTAYIFARGIGLRTAASYIVSLSWMLAPLNQLWMFWCSSDTAAWLPLQLLGVERLVAGRSRQGFAWIIVSATMLLLAGHPETAFTNGLGAGLYFLVRVTATRGSLADLARAAGVALAAWVVALLLSMAQLLPFTEYLANSWTLAERAAEGRPTAVHWAALMCAWVPRYYGISHEPSGMWDTHLGNSNFTAVLYVGISVWMGLALLLTGKRLAPAQRVRTLCLGAVAVLFLLISVDHPLSRWLQHLPVLGTAWRFWFLPFPVFALIVLGATGLDAWFASPRRARELLPAMALSVAVAACIGIAYTTIHAPVLDGATRAYATGELLRAAVLAVVGLGIIAWAVRARAPRVGAPLLAGLAVIDLLMATSGTHPTCPAELADVDTKLIDWLRHADGRTLATNDSRIPAGTLSGHRVDEFSGYDGLVPYRIGRFHAAGVTFGKAWPLLSTRYALAPESPSKSLALRMYRTTLDGYDVFEDVGVWPRAKLVGAARVMSEPEMLDEMKRDDFDPNAAALVSAPLPRVLPEPATADVGTADVRRRTNLSLEVDVHARHDAVLVLSEQHFPGWTARIDGEPADVIAVYGLLRGVVVPAGRHRVTFAYEPRSFTIGLAISLVALIGAASAAVMVLRRPLRS